MRDLLDFWSHKLDNFSSCIIFFYLFLLIGLSPAFFGLFWSLLTLTVIYKQLLAKSIFTCKFRVVSKLNSFLFLWRPYYQNMNIPGNNVVFTYLLIFHHIE